MSALPKAVQSQVDKANEIIAEIQKQGENPELDPIEDGVKEQGAEPKAEEKPEPKPEAKPAEDDFAHKYQVLQGKYNAEVPRLKRQLDAAEQSNMELKQRLGNVETMLATMQAVKQDPKPAAPELPNISDDERAQFGDDLIDLIERVSKRATLPEIQQAKKTLNERVQQVDQSVASTKETMAESQRRQVFMDLDKAVPDWRNQNEDPAFLNWLDERDGFSGQPRGKLLTDAMNHFDSERVIRFFKSFRSENAGATSQPAPEAAPAKAESQEPQAKLDDFVAPGTPKTGTPSAPDESGGRIYTRQDIAAFYAAKNEFVKKGKPIPKKLKEAEEDIFRAQNEGRIR